MPPQLSSSNEHFTLVGFYAEDVSKENIFFFREAYRKGYRTEYRVDQKSQPTCCDGYIRQGTSCKPATGECSSYS